jgi:hypothetical protein
MKLERCPGTGFHAQDMYGNPCASCPRCGRWSSLTKTGKVRYHKRAVGHENPPSWYRKAVSG